MMVKQYIIVNKSLNMSHGKMAAQVAHASSAYFTSLLKKGVIGYNEEKKVYTGEFSIPETIWTHWINGIFIRTTGSMLGLPLSEQYLSSTRS